MGQCHTGAGAGIHFLNICAEHKKQAGPWRGRNNKSHITLTNTTKESHSCFLLSVIQNDIPVPKSSYVSCYLIKPQSTFPSFLAPRYEYPWPASTKESSTQTSPLYPSSGKVSFLSEFERYRLRYSSGNSTEIHLKENSKCTIRKKACVCFSLSRRMSRENQGYCFRWSDFPFLVVGRDHIIPPGRRLICEISVFNPNSSTNWRETRWNRHKRADLFFHQTGNVRVVANGNTKNRAVPTVFIVRPKKKEKKNPKNQNPLFFLHKGEKQMLRTLLWIPAPRLHNGPMRL